MKTHIMQTSQRINDLGLRIGIAFIVMLTAQTLLLAVSAKTLKTLGLDSLQMAFLESSLIAIFIGVSILVLRRWLDRGSPVSIGLNNVPLALSKFFLGFGLLLTPLILSLSVTELAGWAEIKVNWQGARVELILLGMLSVFITDAFPGELVFRGYIFSNLLQRFVKWKSALLTTLLFVLFPLILFPLKKALGAGLTMGLVNDISVGYLGYMLFFGLFAIYLRILTRSIWTGVGFHLMFVYINQLIGLEDTNLVQFSSFNSELPVQLTFAIFLLLTFIALFAYPRIKSIKLGWFEHVD